MLLKTIFILGDIGFQNINLHTSVNLIENKIGKNDIITLLGDNFYPLGVSSLEDPQWDTYNDIFKRIKNPIYSILGNHDYQQNPKAQIEYENWIMKDYYFKEEFDNIDLYFLDTNQFNLEWVSEDIIKKVHNQKPEVLIEKQISWLENELSKNINKKKIVFGHYPMLTNGRYIYQIQKMYDGLIQTFKKYKVNLYISGHEHNIQYIKRNIDELDFNQIIIGSSSECRDDSKNCVNIDMLNFTDNFYGQLNIKENNINIQYFDKNNNLKYEYTINI